jgi:hypothetical protein
MEAGDVVVVVKDENFDVLELRVRCCTCLRRMSKKDKATIVFHEYFNAPSFIYLKKTIKIKFFETSYNRLNVET